MRYATVFFTFVFFLLSSAQIYAATVEVLGRVESADRVVVQDSYIVFTDVSTQKIIKRVAVDPFGNYSVSLPAGTYNISFVPPADSGIAPTTKYNQQINANEVNNFTLPPLSHPAQNTLISLSTLSSKTVLSYAAVILSLMVLVFIGYRIWKRR